MTHVCIYSLESPVAVRETKTSLCCRIALRWQKQTKPSLSFFISVYFFCFYSLQQLLILFAQIQVSLMSFWVQLLLCSCRFEFLSFFGQRLKSTPTRHLSSAIPTQEKLAATPKMILNYRIVSTPWTSLTQTVLPFSNPFYVL